MRPDHTAMARAALVHLVQQLPAGGEDDAGRITWLEREFKATWARMTEAEADVARLTAELEEYKAKHETCVETEVNNALSMLEPWMDRAEAAEAEVARLTDAIAGTIAQVEQQRKRAEYHAGREAALRTALEDVRGVGNGYTYEQQDWPNPFMRCLFCGKSRLVNDTAAFPHTLDCLMLRIEALLASEPGA